VVSVGNDWNFSQVVPAGKGKIYAVEWDGDLLWYRHKGYLDGTKRWLGPVDVGDGFAVASFDPGQDSRIGIFCDCQSGLFSLLSPTGTVIYSVRLNGSLEWYRHDGASSGTISWANGGQPTLVGTGWVAGNRRVFSGGNGVIYLIRDDGTLTWYKHRGYLDGSFDWEQPRDVGDGWDVFTNVFSIGGGIIYAIASDGTLWWYKHNGYQTGEANWEDRKSVGSNWNGLQVVANSVHLRPTIIHWDAVGGRPRLTPNSLRAQLSLRLDLRTIMSARPR
jgi:hypothetical protein